MTETGELEQLESDDGVELECLEAERFVLIVYPAPASPARPLRASNFEGIKGASMYEADGYR
jgi:hypothetical protein